MHPFLSPQFYQERWERRKRIQSRQHVWVIKQSLRSNIIAELENKLSTPKPKCQIFRSLGTALILKAAWNCLQTIISAHVTAADLNRMSTVPSSYINRTERPFLKCFTQFFPDSYFKAKTKMVSQIHMPSQKTIHTLISPVETHCKSVLLEQVNLKPPGKGTTAAEEQWPPGWFSKVGSCICSQHAQLSHCHWDRGSTPDCEDEMWSPESSTEQPRLTRRKYTTSPRQKASMGFTEFCTATKCHASRGTLEGSICHTQSTASG